MVVVELTTHAIDTMNMRAKVVGSNNISILKLLRMHGPGPLFFGVQAILYGYPFSCFVYFYLYASTKKYIRDKYYNESPVTTGTATGAAI